MNYRPRLFIDMDDVVADMNGFIREYHKLHKNSLLGEEHWHSVRQIPNLFRLLKPIDGYKDFINTLFYLYGDKYYIGLLTSLPTPSGHLITAADDKRWWVQNHISGKLPLHTVMGGDNKRFYVNNKLHDILIDDRKSNITAWQKNGGVGIVHTSFENSLNLLSEIIS
jgi:5'-nucleotidase